MAWFALVVALAVVPVRPAGAVPAAPIPAAASVVEAPDYASERWHDPWDYANPQDWNASPATGGGYAWSSGISGLSSAGGTLDFSASAGATMDLIMKMPGALPVGRDTGQAPIDAARYTRASFRMWSSSAAAAAVWWFNCDNPGSCWGAASFATQPGWNTYNITLANTLGGIPWAGPITQFRLMPNSNVGSVQLSLDWVRLYAPSTPATNVTIPEAATQVWWDTDTNPANNGTFAGGGAAGAGPLAGAVGAGATVSFPSDRYPPGTYRVYYTTATETSLYSTPIVVGARPRPVVLDPDVAGGADWATVVRGDAWDFSQPSDVAGVLNASVNVSGGVANGSSAGAQPNDPKVLLPTAGPVDAATYHRLTYTVTYGGTFGLADAPGGGMVARFLWRATGQSLWNETNDMVVYPGTQTVSVDLKTSPPSAINDENTIGPYGWGGPASTLVDEISYDPHEDPGARNWNIDEIRIARNDRGTPGFDIRFRDDAWKPGTVADLFVDSDAAGFDGTQIANDVPVAAGVNTFTWNSGGVGPGTYYVYVVMSDPAGGAGSSYSTGPVDMPAVAPGAPGPVSAVAGTETATVSWSAPASNGGSPLTGYVLTVNPGGGQITYAPGTTSTVVTGLAGGTAHTFTVAARNAIGTGPGTVSNSVTPGALPGARFHPVVPVRVLDSRTALGGWGGVPLGPGEARALQIAGANGIPASATAVIANVTVTNPTNGSFLTTFPAGAALPNASNLNFAPGQTVPNLVTTKTGSGGAMGIFNALGTVHVVVDVVGWFDDGTVAGDEFHGITPARALDSRTATGGWGSTPLGEGQTRDVVIAGGPGTGVPASATAVVMNVTVTQGTRASFLTTFPTGAARPPSSNLNFAAGQTVPNLVTVGIGTLGRVSFFNQLGDVHVVADVVAYFDPSAGGRFHSIAPTRILDSRNGTGGYATPWAGGQSNMRTLVVGGANGIPIAATGVAANVTIANATMPSFLTIYPDGSPNPGTSNNLFGPGPPVPNMTMVQVAPNGLVDIVNQQGSVDVIADVAGYFAPT